MWQNSCIVLNILEFANHFEQWNQIQNTSIVSCIELNIDIVASLMECYEMFLAVIMSVHENVWDECYYTHSSYLHKCY